MAWGKRTEPESASTSVEDEPVVVRPVVPAAPRREAAAEGSQHRVGKSVRVKGELNGGEDVRIDGGFEGTIRLDDHRLVVGRAARVHAEVHARDVIIEGQLVGSVIASDRVEIMATGSVTGDIRAVRLVVVEGARFKGSVDMDASGKGNAARESSAKESPRDASTRETPAKSAVVKDAKVVEPAPVTKAAPPAADDALEDPSLEGPYPSVYEDKF
jgi:cytoskeletal protein CcmA (bactofilin family)